MVKKLNLIILAIAALFAFTSCDKEENNNNFVVAEFDKGVDPLSLELNSQLYTLNIQSNTAWKIVTDSLGFVDKEEGSGNDKVTFTTYINENEVKRKGSIVIVSADSTTVLQTINIQQLSQANYPSNGDLIPDALIISGYCFMYKEVYDKEEIYNDILQTSKTDIDKFKTAYSQLKELYYEKLRKKHSEIKDFRLTLQYSNLAFRAKSYISYTDKNGVETNYEKNGELITSGVFFDKYFNTDYIKGHIKTIGDRELSWQRTVALNQDFDVIAGVWLDINISGTTLNKKYSFKYTSLY